MRKIKPVPFNIETESDLLNFANSVNFAQWVKVKIREEMMGKQFLDALKDILGANVCVNAVEACENVSNDLQAFF